LEISAELGRAKGQEENGGTEKLTGGDNEGIHFVQKRKIVNCKGYHQPAIERRHEKKETEMSSEGNTDCD
jgi:hypothetical protein